MMRFVFILCAAAFLVSSYAVTAAPGNDREATLERTDDFKLYYALDDGFLNCKLRGIYSTKERKYTLLMYMDNNRQDTLLSLEDPLNYQYFGNKLFDALKQKDNTVKPLSSRSIQIVFTWLYTLNAADEDNDVTSGVLWLRQWIMVFPNKLGTKVTKAKEREQTIDNLSEKYGAVQAYTQGLANDLDTFLYKQQQSMGADTNQAFKSMAYATGLWYQERYELQLLREHYTDDNAKLQSEVQTKQEDHDNAKKELASQIAEDSSRIASTKQSLDAKKDAIKNVKESDSDYEQLKKDEDQAEKDYDEAKQKVDEKQKLLDQSTRALKKAEAELNDLTKKLKAKEETVAADSVEKAKAEKWYNEEREKAAKPNNNNTAVKKLLTRLRLGVYQSIDEIKKVSKEIDNKDVQNKINDLFQEYLDEKSRLKSIEVELAASEIYPINKISILFERGYIERIQAWVGNGHGGENIYENIYAIGITSINNLRSLDNIRLFIRKSSGNDYIYLSDLFGNYDNFLANLTRDYSPADTALNNVFPSAQPRLTLRKERIINLFDAKIYTDFAGLQQDAPNGLLQTEVSRRFNIHTYRHQAARSRMDYGTFNYLYVFGAITKFEDKERRLPIRNQNVVVNNTIISPSYTSNLDLRRYENASVGLNLNLLLYDVPDWKFTIYLDAGVRYAHIPIADSVRRMTNGVVDSPTTAINRDAHTITYEFPRLSLEVFSERRVGLTLSYQYNRTYLYSNVFKQIASYEKSSLTDYPTERQAHNMHSFEAMLRVETSRNNNGRLFFRARFFWQKGDANTFFPQLQLGYAYNLIFRKD